MIFFWILLYVILGLIVSGVIIAKAFTDCDKVHVLYWLSAALLWPVFLLLSVLIIPDLNVGPFIRRHFGE
jgi:hypothetical protein